MKRVSCDSRRVRRGDIFYAIPGVTSDGAAFAAAAVRHGAAAVVATRPLDLPVPVSVVPADEIRADFGAAVAAAAGNPSRHLRVWGVTGTNGKTTTTWILGKFLEALPRRHAGLLTTVRTVIGRRSAPSAHTTPDPVSLQHDLAAMRRARLTDCVMEVSSHAIAQDRVAGTFFAGGVFTNLSEDHLDFHKTMAAYFQVKADFFRALARMNPGAPVSVFRDHHPYGPRMEKILRGLPLKVVTCGFSAGVDVRATDVAVSPAGNSFTLSAGGESAAVRCPLAGRYNVANVLSAAALALAAGVPFRSVVRTIPFLRPRWGRLERVASAARATVFVDFAHTDDALANVLGTAREMAKGAVWAVFGAGGDRDRAKRPLMGEAAAAHADHLVVTSDNPRSEDPRAIIADIMKGIPAGADVVVEPDRAKAIGYALARAAADDVVVVCGKGHETTQTIGARVIPFDDRRVVAAWKGVAR